jgi:hypothetical protein
MGADSCRARTLKARNRELSQSLDEAEHAIRALQAEVGARRKREEELKDILDEQAGTIRKLNLTLDAHAACGRRTDRPKRPGPDLDFDGLISYLEREMPMIDAGRNLQAIQAWALLKIARAMR